MVINPDPPNIRRKGALSLPPLARVNRPPAGHPPARTAAFPRVRRLPAPAERGSVTRSNIHQPERIRMNIIASMRLAPLLRLVFNTAALRQAGAGRPSIKAPIKAKSPVIVHDQGKSRQTPKFPSAPVRWTPGAWPLELQVRPSFFAALRLCAFALKPDRRPSIKAPIKAKTPAIVHDQGKSRQRPNYSNAAVGRVTPCAPEVAGAGGARGCDPQQYPSARTYSHEHHRLHDSGHVAAAHRAMLRPPGCSHLRSSAFICGSSPRRASCSRVWRLSQLSSPVGIISVFSLNFTRQT